MWSCPTHTVKCLKTDKKFVYQQIMIRKLIFWKHHLRYLMKSVLWVLINKALLSENFHHGILHTHAQTSVHWPVFSNTQKVPLLHSYYHYIQKYSSLNFQELRKVNLLLNLQRSHNFHKKIDSTGSCVNYGPQSLIKQRKKWFCSSSLASESYHEWFIAILLKFIKYAISMWIQFHK